MKTKQNKQKKNAFAEWHYLLGLFRNEVMFVNNRKHANESKFRFGFIYVPVGQIVLQQVKKKDIKNVFSFLKNIHLLH